MSRTDVDELLDRIRGLHGILAVVVQVIAADPKNRRAITESLTRVIEAELEKQALKPVNDPIYFRTLDAYRRALWDRPGH